MRLSSCLLLDIYIPVGLGLGLAAIAQPANPYSCVAFDSKCSTPVDRVVFGMNIREWFCFHKPPLSYIYMYHVLL
jgi:hypothetical protein